MNDLRSIDLNLLVILDTLLEEAHVSRAAIRLHLSQPAASSALDRLRHLFGDRLLERGRGGMRLTLAAQALSPGGSALAKVYIGGGAEAGFATDVTAACGVTAGFLAPLIVRPFQLVYRRLLIPERPPDSFNYCSSFRAVLIRSSQVSREASSAACMVAGSVSTGPPDQLSSVSTSVPPSASLNRHW